MKLSREILRLAIPSIFANITVPLVGMVDIAIAGHLGGSAAALIGGISVGSMLFDLLYWNFSFLRSGTGGLTAQAYGRGEDTSGILLRALRIALLSGAALVALQWLVVSAAFMVVDCSPEVRELASQYFRIRIWAAPATLSLFALKGWFIGMQDSVRPMTADLLVNGINIGASVGLAVGAGMGFSGIAMGTVIAQWCGFAYCIAAARVRYHIAPAPIPQGGGASFFRLNRDLFLRSAALVSVYIGFTVLSARSGDMMLAVSTIIMKLLMVFSYFTDGFAYAGEALAGRFAGEKNADGFRSTVRCCFEWCLGVVAMFMLLYGLGGVPLFSLMTSDPAVVDAGREFIPWLLLMPLIGCPAFVWDGIFIGATESRHLRNSTLLCAAGFFGCWWAGMHFAGEGATQETAIHILMAAYFVHLAVRSVYLSAVYPNLRRRV